MKLNKASYRVKWTDFSERTARPAGVDEDAEISVSTKKLKLTPTKNNGIHTTTISGTLAVVKSESWVVKGTKTAKLLAHEQGHYDITSLAVREMFEKIEQVKATSLSDLQQQINKIRSDYQTKMNDASALYDTQTDHSRRELEQLRWEKNLKGGVWEG